MTDALTFLKTRRSRPAKILTAPVPDRNALEALLCVAARTPDHGKLEPWRFIVLEQAALRRLGVLARNLAEAAGPEVVDADKASQQFETGQLAVVVVASPKPCDKFPQIEQTYSAGAVCLSLWPAVGAPIGFLVGPRTTGISAPKVWHLHRMNMSPELFTSGPARLKFPTVHALMLPL